MKSAYLGIYRVIYDRPRLIPLLWFIFPIFKSNNYGGLSSPRMVELTLGGILVFAGLRVVGTEWVPRPVYGCYNSELYLRSQRV